MISCLTCGAANALDGKFCKNCGSALPAELMEDAHSKHERLLEDGFRLIGEGRDDEARMVAESVLAENPRSPRALSLMGLCQERRGDLASALATYERLLDYNPDSALDKIKVNHLRRQLSIGLAHKPPPNRRLALVGAGAAVLLVASIAVSIAAFQSRPAPQKVAANTPAPATQQPVATGFEDPAETYPDAVPNPAQTGGASEAPETAEGAAPGTTTGPVAQPPAGATGLPNPMEGTIESGAKPIVLDVVPERARGSDNTRDPEPSMGHQENGDAGDTEAANGEAEAQATEPDPGVIEIKVHRGTTPAAGGGTTRDPNELQVLLKAATEQYQLGKYDTAAKGLERALGLGADPGRYGQRLGQCYEKLGRSDDAIRAYERAAQAYESAAKSGGSSADRLTRAAEACRQAARALRGG